MFVEEIRAIIWVELNQTITKANNSTKFLTSLTNRKTIPKKRLGTTVIVRNHLPSAVSIKHILAKKHISAAKRQADYNKSSGGFLHPAHDRRSSIQDSRLSTNANSLN